MAATSEVAKFLAGTLVSSEIEEVEVAEEDPYLEGFGEIILKMKTLLKQKRIVEGQEKEMIFELP